jgi:hypothetical protein
LPGPGLRDAPHRRPPAGDVTTDRLAPAEQVAGRWPGGRHVGRQPEVGENLLNDARVLDGGQHARAPATARAREDVHRERVAERVSPRPGARCGPRRRWLRGATGRRLPIGRGAGRPGGHSVGQGEAVRRWTRRREDRPDNAGICPSPLPPVCRRVSQPAAFLRKGIDRPASGIGDSLAHHGHRLGHRERSGQRVHPCGDQVGLRRRQSVATASSANRRMPCLPTSRDHDRRERQRTQHRA